MNKITSLSNQTSKGSRKTLTDLVEEFLTQSNPFEERDDILYTVGSKVMMIQEVKDSVQRASIIGENQYKKFLSEVIEFKRKNIHDIITKNNLAIFKKKNSTSLCKSKQKVLSLKQDYQLYASLYVACQARKSDLSDFFSHENYSYPPALSKFGKLNHTNKSDTISILEKLEPSQHNVPGFDTIIFDGAAVVQMISPNTSQTFQQYCRNVLHSFLMHKINKVKRADIVFDIYKDHSIKSTAKERSGFGRRVKVSCKTPIPKNWQNFLRVNENKAKLFELISDYVTWIECDKIIVATKNEKAVTNDIHPQT